MVLIYAKKTGNNPPSVVMMTSMGPDGRITKNRIMRVFPGHGYNSRHTW